MATAPRYGTPNFEMLATWIGRPPEEDGPFWALNLMKYREVADYTDGDGPAISGREADDRYLPRGPLAAIGAMIAFGADVTRQTGEGPTWDRIGIVRYPTRVAFLDMQRRDDFKAQHKHKDAGMDTTIVMSCLPEPAGVAVDTPDTAIVLRVARLAEGETLPAVDGATRLVTFGVEGVIIGDERTWTHAAFDAAPTPEVEAALHDAGAAEEQIAVTVVPVLDALAESVRSAAEVAG